ncbi:MAG: glutamate 5-kinase, partial [Candidatus Omnitrophica bacterium]|nr:glutamate 5-kinase [Candidatus Omnitrophota bacterium]
LFRSVKVLLVTSGAIGAGMWLLNIKKRPVDRIAELQAAASIGQGYLMHLYSEYFKDRGYLVGQILLTQEDFNDRKRYLNIKHTVDALLKHNVIPIINENDTVATDEIRCGDNDRLSNLLGDLCQADKLIILTDVDGLLDQDGNVISAVDEITPRILKLAGASSCDLGTGGMSTKLECAKNSAQAGIECVIANGKKKDVLLGIMSGEDVGTVFGRREKRFIARKRWIGFSSKPKGTLRIDDGAREALKKKDKSLLASGVSAVSGHFVSGDVVSIVDNALVEIGRGVVNYSSAELSKIKGMKTAQFKAALGYKGKDEIVHKDNLVIL